MSDRHILTVPATVAILVVAAGLGWVRPSLVPVAPAAAAGARVAVAPVPAAAPVAADPGPLQGIDVSHFQGTIDWARVSGAGMRFAYAKATEGITYVDPAFAANAAGASAQGLPFGGYHFFRPNDDPVRQAEHFLKNVTVGSGSLPPALDVEVAAASGIDLAADVAAWVAHVAEATGCTPLVYANRTFWERALAADAGASRVWLAEYAAEVRLPGGVRSWVIWQHSDKGRVPGIDGTVDLDRFGGGASALQQVLCS